MNYPNWIQSDRPSSALSWEDLTEWDSEENEWIVKLLANIDEVVFNEKPVGDEMGNELMNECNVWKEKFANGSKIESGCECNIMITPLKETKSFSASRTSSSPIKKNIFKVGTSDRSLSDQSFGQKLEPITFENKREKNKMKSNVKVVGVKNGEKPLVLPPIDVKTMSIKKKEKVTNKTIFIETVKNKTFPRPDVVLPIEDLMNRNKGANQWR